MALLAKFLRVEDGQTILEYGMILTLVSTAMIAALMLLKVGLGDYYDSLADALAAIS